MSDEPGGPMETARENAGCVLGIATGLLAIVVFSLGIFGLTASELDPAEELSKAFEVGVLPHGLAADSAAKLPGGDRLVRLVGPDFEPLPVPAPKKPSFGGAEDGGPSADPAGESEVDEPGTEGAEDDESSATEDRPRAPEPKPLVSGTAPQEAFLLFPAAAKRVVSAFEGEAGDDFGGGGGGGGRRGRRGGGGFGGVQTDKDGFISMDRGELDWGPFRVGFRHKRRVLDDGAGTHEEIRVNLSGEGLLCVLVVRWPLGHAAEVGPVEELLEALAPREG